MTESGAPRRDEYLLRLAFLVSTTGDWIYRFALPLLVLQLTGSALSTALTYVVEFIPYVVIGAFAGVVADRSDCRRLMIACDGVAAVVVGVIAVVFTADHPPVAALYVAALLLACVRPFWFPALQSFLVARVPESRRPTANAWVQGTDSTLTILGPAAGLSVVVLIGPAVACALNAVSFIASAALIGLTTAAGRRARAVARVTARGLGTEFLAGLRVMVVYRAVFWGTALLTLTNFAALAVESNLIYVLTGGHGHAPTGLGVVFAMGGAGALLGAAVAPALIRRCAVGRLLTFGMALVAAGLALPALWASPVLVGISWFIVGGATSMIVVPWFTFRQSILPNDMIGRVTSASRSISYASIPLGALAGSWVLTSFGRTWLFLAAGAVQAAVALGALLSPLGRIDERMAGVQPNPHAESPLAPAAGEGEPGAVLVEHDRSVVSAP